MIISDETSYPVLIDSVDTPTLNEYFWVLELSYLDFMLNRLKMFEEHTTPTLEILVDDYWMEIPTNWNILVYSEETAQLDVAEISDLTRARFTAVLYKHKTGKIVPAPVKVIDYHHEAQVKFPSLNKHTMLCHHAGPDSWVCVAPTDNYNKYLKNKLVGDLMTD